MSTLNVYALFHLNLAFSSIEEEQRPDVISRCYWPLLRLPDVTGVPVAIEATGYTLESIAAIDPAWISTLRQKMADGSVEFIGSGYAQIIGPLVPARVNQANLAIGNTVYERILGQRPAIALVNEQAFSAGLVPLYLEAGYRAIMMDWDNVASHHPQWPAELKYHPQRARGTDDSEIQLLWTHTMAFQKLQRLAHGDIEYSHYLEFIESQRGSEPRVLPVYSNDAEVFDFRPRRFQTEERVQAGEWDLVARTWEKLARTQRARFMRPSQALLMTDSPSANHLLDLQTPAYPVPVKKHRKYNITRWAVSGRDDTTINAACHRILEGLVNHRITEMAAWKELCYLWSSDFRTHITDRRWKRFRDRLSAAEEALDALARPVPDAVSAPAIASGQKWLEVETPALEAVLNCRRGMAIHEVRVRGDNRPAMLVSLLHGYFQNIELQVDWYTGNCVFEAPGVPKVSDLDWARPRVYGDGATADAIVEGEIETPLGPIFKRMRFCAASPRVEFDLVFKWREYGRGSLRLGHFLLNPQAFDRETLYFATHNGGPRRERFPLARDTYDHGLPVSFLVSATTGLGMTEGGIEIGDASRSFRVEVDQGVAPLIGLMNHERSGEHFFSRLALSALELDDTRKPESVAGPRHFRFAVNLAA